MADACKQMHRFHGVTFYICFSTSKVSFFVMEIFGVPAVAIWAAEARVDGEGESSYLGLLNPCLLSPSLIDGLGCLCFGRAGQVCVSAGMPFVSGEGGAPAARKYTRQVKVN